MTGVRVSGFPRFLFHSLREDLALEPPPHRSFQVSPAKIDFLLLLLFFVIIKKSFRTNDHKALFALVLFPISTGQDKN